MKFVKCAISLFVGILTYLMISSPFFNVLAQSSAESSGNWREVDGVVQLSEYSGNLGNDSRDILFVDANCEACENLFLDMEEGGLGVVKIYLLDVTENEERLAVLKDAYEFCGTEEESLLVPLLFSSSNCYTGYLDIKNRISALILQENVVLASEGLSVLESYEVAENKDKYADKDVTEIVLDETKMWEWLVLGGIGVLAVGFLVYWVVNRRSVGRKEKTIFAVVQSLLFVLPTVYLGYKVNTAVNLGREYSSACDAFTGSGCVSYAERQVARANSEEYAKANPKTAAKATEYVKSKGGAEAAIAEGNALVEAGSQGLLDAAKNYLGEQANAEEVWAKAKEIQTAMSSESITAVVDQGSQMIKVGKIFVDTASAYAVSPEKVYIAQVQSIPTINESSISCSSLATCETALLKRNADAVANLSNETNKDSTNSNLYVYQFDSLTGQIVRTPINASIIDGYCEATTTLSGDGSIAEGTLCSCSNSLGGSAYTRSDSGASCDAVCRVRFPCSDCNPTPPPPPNPPPNGGPYCGDGILGNTTGEECEYGDPSGVKCSWNNCDGSCNCPPDPSPYCGDGKLNNDYEKCELGNPLGVECNWDSCNQVLCQCVKSGCGDGVLDQGESCERGDPNGVSCLWDTECSQLDCSCKGEPSIYCGDGVLQEGESCEVGNPSGTRCDWSVCSKYTCTCPGSPNTGLLDEQYDGKLLLGAVLIGLGVLFQPLVSLINHSYIVITEGVVRIGRYVEKIEKEVSTSREISKIEKRRRRVEDSFK